jgi:hypothetical protein
MIKEKEILHKEKLDPLAYLLEVINDAEATPSRRDRLALAALPYCHHRVEGRRVSKKQQTEASAKRAVTGGSVAWGNDLRTSSNGQSD